MLWEGESINTSSSTVTSFASLLLLLRRKEICKYCTECDSIPENGPHAIFALLSVCLSVSGPWWSVSSVALLRRRRRSAMFVPQKEEDASRKFNLPKVPECLHSTCICPNHCETFFPPQRPTTRPDTLLMNINCNRFCFCSTNLLTIKVAPLLFAFFSSEGQYLATNQPPAQVIQFLGNGVRL